MTDTAELTLTTLPLANLAAHPDNIRKRLGDLDELSKSIAGVGILEPLLVLPADDKGVHLVAAGSRRREGWPRRGPLHRARPDRGRGDRGDAGREPAAQRRDPDRRGQGADWDRWAREINDAQAHWDARIATFTQFFEETVPWWESVGRKLGKGPERGNVIRRCGKNGNHAWINTHRDRDATDVPDGVNPDGTVTVQRETETDGAS